MLETRHRATICAYTDFIELKLVWVVPHLDFNTACAAVGFKLICKPISDSQMLL